MASSSKVNGQHNSVIFRDPAQINPPVQYLSLLGGGNICSGVAVVPPLNFIYYGDDSIEMGLAVDLRQKADKSTTYKKPQSMP